MEAERRREMLGVALEACDELLAEAREGTDLDRLNELENLRASLWRQQRSLEARRG